MSAWTGWAACSATTLAHHIGFVFQMFNLIPYLSVVENVLLPCRFSDQRRLRALRDADSPEAEALRLLRQLDMTDATLLRRPVTSLSVGQQQRVAAARALIGAPALLIADEPTSSLDSDRRESFIRLCSTNVPGPARPWCSSAMTPALNRCSTARCACRKSIVRRLPAAREG